ncbi:MAG: YihY/virulence factor BrkB family protein [Bacteroides sp.]|nr:YihY/virulence factor BrkB family protein [Eubacterium sp.]MCM1418298.1 YihY/virulence factor BrkB family protein [Roseburia sp.]MCM1462401.1 YihY/virulence factor BrkB family protein [Bacteroides sp.]
MNKILILKLYTVVKCVTERFRRDNLNEYAAYSALFMILSFVPFIMILLNIMKNFPIFSETSTYELEILSDEVGGFITRIIAEAREKANGAILSVTTVVALWSASRGLIGIINGLNRIHRVKETRGFLRLRISAVFYMILFILAMLAVLVLLVFGQAILERLIRAFPIFESFDGALFTFRWAIGFGVLILFFLFIYAALPIQKSRPFSKLPGAVFSAAGWLGFSALYSFYVNRLANYSYVYGSLTTVALLILWLYICMYILFLGEELNLMLSSGFFKKIGKWIPQKQPIKKETS